MGGDSDDESRPTVTADQLLSMGSCSVQEIDQVRLIVACRAVLRFEEASRL